MPLSKDKTAACTLREKLLEAAHASYTLASEICSSGICDPEAVYNAVSLSRTLHSKVRDLSRRHQLSPE